VPAVQSEAAASASVSSAEASGIAASYSTTVGGKSYSASITQSNGTYQLAVPNLPGATVSGSSLQAAENALKVKIDSLA
jgi:hypothetical protein